MAVPVRPPDAHDPVNSIVDSSPALEHSSSTGNFSSDSDEQVGHGIDPARQDEADDVIGVSIGRTQSRMKARLTPAEEKNRIMERNGGYFETIPDASDSDGLFASEFTAEPEDSREANNQPSNNDNKQNKEAAPSPTPAPTASPQNAAQPDEKDSGPRSSFTRSILKNSLPLRPRAWSGDSAVNRSLKKFLPDLGSLTKRSSLSFRSNSSQRRSQSQSLKPPSPVSSTPFRGENEKKEEQPRRRSCTNPFPNTAPVDEPISELRPLGGPTAPAKHSFARRPSATVSGAPPVLRRSSSDRSLYLRASSTASSLDHQPDYEHVHSQVNSRFKAIKDSLQDSSSRLLNMPTLHLPDLRNNDWSYNPFNESPERKPDGSQSTRGVSGDQTSQPKFQPPPRTNSNPQHPILNEAISGMTGDVVVLGGYRGSILRSAKPPQRQLWVPMKVGLNLRKVDLEVGLHPEDEERMEETIIPSGVLSHVGPVDICRRLMKRLQKSENAVKGDLRVWDYGYDWRLSPHLLSRRLIKFLEGLPCNAPGVPREKRGAHVIAHSLGGLITRHAVNQRPELFAGVVYAGVPQHCVNILGPLRNGDDVLLSSRVLTAQVNFSFRTSFALLPEDGHCFIDKRTKEEYRVDFFSPQAWEDWRLSPVVSQALPALTRGTNFKDNLPRLGKRFSTVLSSKESLSSDDANTADSSSSSPSGVTTDDEFPRNQTGHHHYHRPNANMVHDAADKATQMAPNIDGVVGPTSNPRGPAAKATNTVTIPHDAAMAYLERTLPEVLRFKQELAFNPAHQSSNRYPPFTVLYGKSVPTVYGARIWSSEQIKCQDAYDDLAFAAGDGVCLASAAMLPPGYRIIKGGLVKSERGHVGLLGDLEGVGQCLQALARGRQEGVGMGECP